MNDKEKFCVIYTMGRIIHDMEIDSGNMTPDEAGMRLSGYLAGLCERYHLTISPLAEKEIEEFLNDITMFCESEVEKNISK